MLHYFTANACKGTLDKEAQVYYMFYKSYSVRKSIDVYMNTSYSGYWEITGILLSYTLISTSYEHSIQWNRLLIDTGKGTERHVCDIS